MITLRPYQLASSDWSDVEFQETGMVLPDGLPFERWQAIGESLKFMEKSVHWWVGDWIRYGERTYGETYTQAIEETNLSYQTLRNDVWVAEHVELSRRRDNLSFGHHEAVAKLEPPEQEQYLDLAEENKWTRQELRQAVQGNAPERTTAQLLVASDGNEWYTPSKYIEAARATLGVIDLDPASSAAANETVRASRFYTQQDDGLSHEWYGRLWLNPPYGGLASAFTSYLVQEYAAGHVASAVVLLNASCVGTGWFQPLWEFTLCFTNHRIGFISTSREISTSTYSNVFIYLGPSPETFAEKFSSFGVVARRWPS